MKIIRVLSRSNFNTYCKQELWDVPGNFEMFDTDTAIIEILDTMDSINSTPFFGNTNCNRILKVYFDDVDGPIGDAIPISYNQSIEIIDFIVNNKCIDKFIVHCAAGISRSGAVGSFIYNYFKSMGEDVDFPEYNKVIPNVRVHAMLNRFFYVDR